MRVPNSRQYIGDARGMPCDLFPLKVVLALNLYLVGVVLRLSNPQRKCGC